jgi:hypothetical protein
MENLRSIKHDYTWREYKKGDEITCRHAFLHLYRLSCLLEDFIKLNKIAAQKIIDKYSKYFPEDKETIQNLNIHSTQFNLIIKIAENLKEEILEFYSQKFFNGDRKGSEKNIKRNLSDKFIYYTGVIIQVWIVMLLLLAFLLLTFLIPKESDFTREKISVFFPAFSFTLMLILFFIYIPIIILILKEYRINYIYLLELGPELIYPPAYLLKVLEVFYNFK